METSSRGPVLMFGLAMLVAATLWVHAGCGGDTLLSPSDTVVGRWHGTTVVQTAGPVLGGFSREDITFRADGTAAIAEYEGLMRSDEGVWSLSGNAISIDFPSFCDRRGTVAGGTMNLTCALDTRTWALVDEKQ